jgi:hypothetical protein
MLVAIWPITSLAPSMSNYRGKITCSSSVMSMLFWEVEESLTRGHQGPEGDVRTMTILFTDIVSTEQSARLGHGKWITLTDEHDAMVRATLQATKGMKSRRLVMGSWPRSMLRLGLRLTSSIKLEPWG